MTTTVLYPLSLHDALPIFGRAAGGNDLEAAAADDRAGRQAAGGDVQGPAAADDGRARDAGRGTAVRHVQGDRKSTRLNSSHRCMSYAVFCLTKTRRSLRSR